MPEFESHVPRVTRLVKKYREAYQQEQLAKASPPPPPVTSSQDDEEEEEKEEEEREQRQAETTQPMVQMMQMMNQPTPRYYHQQPSQQRQHAQAPTPTYGSSGSTVQTPPGSTTAAKVGRTLTSCVRIQPMTSKGFEGAYEAYNGCGEKIGLAYCFTDNRVSDVDRCGIMTGKSTGTIPIGSGKIRVSDILHAMIIVLRRKAGTR